MIEVLTAAVLVMVGLIGALAALDGAKRGSYTAQRHEQAIALAQAEIERLRAYSFDLLELDAAPAPVTDASNNPVDPRAYVDDTNGDGASDQFLILTNYHDRAGGPPADSPPSEPLIVDPNPTDDAATIAAVSAGVPIGPSGGQTTATVYRFITRRDETCVLAGTTTDLCGGAEIETRRITVAVALGEVGNGAGPRTPVYASSVVADPDAVSIDGSLLP